MIASAPNNIRHFRKALKLSQRDLAERVNTSSQQIQRLETGQRKLTVDWLERIAAALCVRTIDLIGDNPPSATAILSRPTTIEADDLKATLSPILSRFGGNAAAVEAAIWRDCAREANIWVAEADESEDITSHLAQYLLPALAIILTRDRPQPLPELLRALRPHAHSAARYLLSLPAPAAGARKSS